MKRNDSSNCGPDILEDNMGMKTQTTEVLDEANLGLLDGPIAMIVEGENGEKETLHLTPPIQMKEGKFLNVLSDAKGYDHFFTKEDGFYDGWGQTQWRMK
jgi:hypothetical protein